jgi:hypothetical protein
VERIRRDSYKLQLPKGIEHIHLVFYTLLLRPDPNDLLPGQHITPQGPVQIANDATDAAEGIHNKQEVEEVLDS